MSSAEYLRELVKDRLTAAAEEIFSVFKTTIVQYEQEIDRQRKLLDIVWKPEVKLQRIEIPQQHVCEEEEEEVVHTEQQLSNKDCNSSVTQKEPEPLHIKEEQHGPFTSQEGEEVTFNQETYSLLLTPTHEESEHCETKPESNHQPLSHNSHVTKTQDQSAGKHGGSGSTRDAVSKSKQREIETSGVKDLKWSRKTCNSHAGEKRFKCETCGKAFKRKTALQRHFRVHTGEKPHSCDTCGKRFSDAQYLKEHLRVHTGEKPYACKTCGKHYRYGAAFRYHLKIHTGERPHSCSICKRAFHSPGKVKIHMRKHTGEKPYSCDTCGKRYSTAKYVKEHMAIHTGEMPYTCKTCGKHFRFAAAFRGHLKIHTGERTHTCSICKRDFYSTGNLKIHMRKHTGEKPYPCNICGKHFISITQLNRHMRVHTGEKPHSCDAS